MNSFLNNTLKAFPRALVLFMALVSSSCGYYGPDLETTIKDDLKGIKAGSNVVWRGAEIGTVKSVTLVTGAFKVEITLKPEFQNQIHVGAKAVPENSVTNGFNPALVIIGGTDINAPLLKEGATIEEGGTVEFAVNQAKEWEDSVALLIAGLVVCILIFGRLSRFF